MVRKGGKCYVYQATLKLNYGHLINLIACENNSTAEFSFKLFKGERFSRCSQTKFSRPQIRIHT